GIRDGHVTGVQTCALPIFPFRQCALLDSLRLPFCIGKRALHAEHIFARACELRGPAWLQPRRIGHGLELRVWGKDVRLPVGGVRSEERRVGKECRCWWWAV